MLDTGYWMLDTGYWMLDAGYWILDAGYWMLDTGYWILIAGYWSLNTGHRFLVIPASGIRECRSKKSDPWLCTVSDLVGAKLFKLF
jgi:hypothetical protein